MYEVGGFIWHVYELHNFLFHNAYLSGSFFYSYFYDSTWVKLICTVMLSGVIKLNIYTVHNSKVKQYEHINWYNINLRSEMFLYTGVYPFKMSEYIGYSGKSKSLSSNWILIWFVHQYQYEDILLFVEQLIHYVDQKQPFPIG